MQKKFKREIQALGQIFYFIDEYSTVNSIQGTVLFSLKFVIEELFTNMIKYSVSDTNSDISIDLNKRNGQLIIQLTDFGVDAFDITNARDADVTLSLEERKIGGLGIHLIKKMVDSISYEYKDRQSTITLAKNLEPEHV